MACFHRPLIWLLLSSTLGCAKRIDADEAGLVLDGAWLVSEDVLLQLRGALRGEDNGILVSAGDDGGHVAGGIVEAGSGWSGRVLVDGEVQALDEGSDDHLTTLALGMSGVAIASPPLLMDGELALSVFEAHHDSGSSSMVIDLTGQLSVAESAKGEAVLDVLFDVETDAGGVVTCTASGDVSGFEVISCVGTTVELAGGDGGDTGDTGA